MTNPHNPIGCCYPESILRELMAFCKEKDIHYISDEIFAMTAFSDKEDEKFISALSLVNMSEAGAMNPSRVHILYSLSKDFGAAGLRMVSGASQRPTIRKRRELNSSITNPNL
jgi:aspartate/methionine/tyrosine aminotransferase